MKCCMSTDVGTWMNWLTFELDPDHSPDAVPGLLSVISYRLWNFAALPRLPASCAAMRNFTLGKIPCMYTYWRRTARAVVLKWFYSLSRFNTFVRGKCGLPSALLAIISIIIITPQIFGSILLFALHMYIMKPAFYWNNCFSVLHVCS